MKPLRQLPARNMKENRGRLWLSQSKLEKRAGLSTQYIAMIELARKFPAPKMLEKTAAALEIDPPELFSMTTTAAQARKPQKTP